MVNSNTQNNPPFLQKGDRIRIVAPAKAIDSILVEYAQKYLEENGFEVVIGKHTTGRWNYFSGTDDERQLDFQEALDDEDCKAILCARGGYGCVRIFDRINWAGFLRSPKWVIGFSDVTVFHHRIQAFELPSIHATMPLNFQANTPEALNSLLKALEGKENTYQFASSINNKSGKATGNVIGGNLSIVYSLLGTKDRLDCSGNILFLEDLAEQLYAVDRMFFALEKAGVFEQISGLIIGGMTDMKDTNPPTNFTIYDIILEKLRYRKIPICFDFPAGHINDNRTLILGKNATLDVTEELVVFMQ